MRALRLDAADGGDLGVAGTGAAQISPGARAGEFRPAILLAWQLGTRLFDARTGLAAAAAMALWPLDIEYAGLAFPDAVQSALLAGAMCCFLAAKEARRGWLCAVAAGALWAWAYYVKIDAFFLGFVLLAAVLLRLASWRHLFVTGAVSLALVSVELGLYGIYAGDALLRLHLESAAANEVFAAGHDYRSLLTYPKAMFAVPYEAGLHYYLFAIGAVASLWLRRRTALLLLIWCALWQDWLMFGADPFAGLSPEAAAAALSAELVGADVRAGRLGACSSVAQHAPGRLCRDGGRRRLRRNLRAVQPACL